MDFGAFVEIRPGVEGLCHISQIDNERVDNIEKFIKPDDEVMVTMISIIMNGMVVAVTETCEETARRCRSCLRFFM